jgi:hypothetical protein
VRKRRTKRKDPTGADRRVGASPFGRSPAWLAPRPGGEALSPPRLGPPAFFSSEGGARDARFRLPYGSSRISVVATTGKGDPRDG